MLAMIDGKVREAATNAAVAAATAAEAFAVLGGNGGDHHGSEGIEPVITGEAAASSAIVLEAIEAAGREAAARTNANAGRVADSIILAATALGAKPGAKIPVSSTGRVRYNTLKNWEAEAWEPSATGE